MVPSPASEALVLLISLLLVACAPTGDSAKDSVAVDADGDGYDSTVDCDDTVAQIHPDAEEECDGIDNNCDGTADEGLGTDWFQDLDGDGYGDPAATKSDCTQPDGYVTDSTDCNDHYASISPGATEICDGLDNNCDDQTDEGVTTTYYADADRDGYGDDTTAEDDCEEPDGYVDVGGDCDDSDRHYNPAAEETDCTDPNDYNCDGSVDYADADGDGWAACKDCDDADAAISPDAVEVCDPADVDEDCSGLADDNDPGTTGMLDLYYDEDGDGYGNGDAPIVKCDLGPGFSANGDDCDDTDAAISPGASEVCNEVDDNCDGTADEGVTVTQYRDADGDGYGVGVAVVACGLESGYALMDGDCDDGEAHSNPGEREVCDGLDNDCDGDVDESLRTTVFQDSDGDGYGDDSVSESACSVDPGWATVGGDCDDTDAAFHPDAAETDCTDPNDYNCDGAVAYADDDGDGWAACVDCDDTDADARPDGAEVCDRVDNDCDSLVDEADDSLTGGQTVYADTDADWYGDPSTGVFTCFPTSGTVNNGDDCDDTNSSAHPGATEVCDGFDDDCDGRTDLGAADATTWYVDKDGDGYGVTSFTRVECTMPSGYAATSTDCDDTTATVHPGLADDCDDVDNDCDGSIDEDGTTTIYTDADLDGYGDRDATASAGCVEAGWSTTDDDCNDSNANVGACGFVEFTGTYGSSWTTLGTMTNGGESLLGYQDVDITYEWNFYGPKAQYLNGTTWTAKSTVNPYATSSYAVPTSYGGKIWWIRGAHVESYAPTTDTFSLVTSVSQTESYTQTESDEYGVIYGYSGDGRLIEYDSTKGTTTYKSLGLGSLSITRLGYDPTQRALYLGSATSTTLYKYDLTTGATSTTAPMPESELNPIFCSDRSGHLYAAGGTVGKTIYQYTTKSNTWARITDVPADHGQIGSCGVSTSGYLYVSPGNTTAMRLDLY